MAKKIIEKVVETPAKVLDKTIEESKKIGKAAVSERHLKKAKDYWEMLGPGLTTGASDDDPSGIATYSQAGSQFGYRLLWLAPFTFPLMAAVQEMCARIGLVTGRGLAANIRIHFPRSVLYISTLLLFIANAFNIGADLGAMAAATRLLFAQLSFSFLVVIFAVLILFLQIFSSYQKYAKYLKWLSLILLAYVFSVLMIEGLNWKEILIQTIRPTFSFNKDFIFIVCAVLGTTISPYLFFWQTSQEVEEAIERGRTNIKLRQDEVTDEEIKEMRLDIFSGMFFSNLVMFFIIVACAAVLNASGITDIKTAAQAAEALRPFAGDASYFLFTIGIIGTGLLGIPVLAGSSSYAFAESFGFREGLHKKLRQAYSFYGLIIISVLVGLILNFVGLDPIKALIWAAVINGLVAPVILAMIVVLSSNKKIMGDRVNHKFTTLVGWMITAMMALVGLLTIFQIIG